MNAKTLARDVVRGLKAQPGGVKNQTSFIVKDANGALAEVLVRAGHVRVNLRDKPSEKLLRATKAKDLVDQPSKRLGRGKTKPRWALGLVVDDAADAPIARQVIAELTQSATPPRNRGRKLAGAAS